MLSMLYALYYTLYYLLHPCYPIPLPYIISHTIINVLHSISRQFILLYSLLHSIHLIYSYMTIPPKHTFLSLSHPNSFLSRTNFVLPRSLPDQSFLYQKRLKKSFPAALPLDLLYSCHISVSLP